MFSFFFARTRHVTRAWVMRTFLPILGVLALAAGSAAQSYDATALRQPIDLGMKWALHAGDDPAYAQPGFDDSHWMVVDPAQSLKTYFPNTNPRVVWYRLHVKVAPNQSGLALEEWNLGSAFEIYVNGEKLISAGSVVPYVPYTFDGRLLKPIPQAAIASGSLLIAMRVRISSTDWINAFPGFYPYNLSLGQADALSDHLWLAVIGDRTLDWFNRAAGLGLGIVALALFGGQRRQREYLWIFFLFLSEALQEPLSAYRIFHDIPAQWSYLSYPFQAAGVIFGALMYFALLRIPMRLWFRILLALTVLGMLIATIQNATGNGSALVLLLSVLPQTIVVAMVLPVLLIVHWRRGNREAGILLVPVLLSSVTIYLQLGSFVAAQQAALASATQTVFNVLMNWQLGPFTINIGTLAHTFFLLSLAVIIVLRSTRIAHQQALIESELAAAREVQQILVPEYTEGMPGFDLESAYEPAQQVGGDFFQILPAANDSLLVVIGDVAGKGLPAAMLVSVLVGAIRGVAAYSAEPAELLAQLNQRLAGRAGGNLATALAARIWADGSIVLANAGHLPPYLDGKEVEVPGALPLGARLETRYETVRFHLARGSRLIFYSDGIVEAQNAQGELLGFERSRALSTQPVAQIVEAAKLFGQQDDITAIAITRRAEAETRAWQTATPALDALPL